MFKCDLHVHSRYSAKPTNWITRKTRAHESYTEPEFIYQTALERGMTHVTITDHNEIGGCLELKKYSNTFVSCEVTARFPEDRCKIHIPVYDITEKQYNDIMYFRKDIYELSEYLTQHKIHHTVAHLLFSVNQKLQNHHIEKLLPMFDFFELNGFRSVEFNDVIKDIINKLTPELLEILSTKHNIKNPKADPSKKYFTTGSDDHSGKFIARSFTENPGNDLNSIFTNGQNNIIHVQPSNPKHLAYAMYSISYTYLQQNLNIGKYAEKDLGLQVLDKMLSMDIHKKDNLSIFLRKIKKKILKNNDRKSLKQNIAEALQLMSKYSNDVGMDNVSENWFKVVSEVCNICVKKGFENIIESMKKGDIFSVFETIGAIASIYMIVSPYYVGYSIFQEARDFYSNLNIDNKITRHKETSVIHFTDTFYEINGVVRTLQQTLLQAKQQQKKYNFVTSAYRDSLLGEKVFKPIDIYDVPEYPELKLAIPPILDIIQYCYDQKVTHIHSATPGPMGLAALITSIVLRKPLITTYHTAFPQFVKDLIGDKFFEDVTWSYMRWYYDFSETIFVPSEAFKEDLILNGFNQNKLKISPRGVDIDFFTPNYDLKKKDGFKLIYIGRISKEKGLDKLADAYKTLNRDDVELVIIGDGPYRKEMEILLKNTKTKFTGYLMGEALLDEYRSADLFVFPSLTDTFGNVVLEANACGTPVIVTDKGGPHENVIHNETGFIIEGNSPDEIKNAINELCFKPKLSLMWRASRKYVEPRSFRSAFNETWNFYEGGGEDN